MESNTLIVLFFSIICVTENHSPPNSIHDGERGTGAELIYTSILFRHGERTPLLILPTDPYKLSYWEEGIGQLTKVGKLQEYELGKWIRRYYAGLIDDKPYRHDVLTMLSSDVERTLMSAEAVLAGMYPPSDEEMWNSDNLRWQPIPVHTIPKELDNLISYSENVCKRYNLELKSVDQLPEFIALYEKYRDVFEYVSVQSGTDFPENDIEAAIYKLYEVYDTLSIEVRYNRTLQNWTRQVYPEPMKAISVYNFIVLSYTEEQKRLRGGPILKSMIDGMTKKAASNSSQNTKFLMYSGHDTTISVLLDTLGVFNGISPPLSAAVMVELRKKDEDHFVRVLYRNSTLTAPYTLKIPGCERDDCMLEEFVRVTASRIPDDWKSECEVGFLTKLFYKFTFVEFVVTVLVVLFVAAVTAIVGRQYYISRRRRKEYQTIPDSKD